MDGYQGEKVVPASKSPFASHETADWAMEFIEHYGGIEGDHHRAWVLDQVARILKGTRIVVKKATWGTGPDPHVEWRFATGEPSARYRKWVRDMKRGSALRGEPDEYGYDEGIAP